jgi:AraC-like DNA-binding protein
MTSIDRLSAILERFRVRARLFHEGPLCGTTPFEAVPGRAFLHVLRRGEMELLHPGRSPKDAAAGHVPTRLNEPTLLFYPRAVPHTFVTPARGGAHLTCAALDFEGGECHPLVRALPACLVIPLAQVDGLEQSLALLFAETDRVRCGHRLLADRLFEVVLIQLLRWLIDHPGASGMSAGLLQGLSDPRLARALIAMHEAPGQDWTLEAIAKCAGMSRSALALAFRQTVGVTPGDYLADWRIVLAQQQMLRDRPLQLIAQELGYSDASALARLFSKRLGLSPHAWRKAQRGTGNEVGTAA